MGSTVSWSLFLGPSQVLPKPFPNPSPSLTLPKGREWQYHYVDALGRPAVASLTPQNIYKSRCLYHETYIGITAERVRAATVGRPYEVTIDSVLQDSIHSSLGGQINRRLKWIFAVF